jgi:hypothetical protein
MILDRDEIAPVKASTIIEQVDANTLEVVSTFSSQSEAERQTGIPRNKYPSRPAPRPAARGILLALCTVVTFQIILCFNYHSDTV